MQTKGFIYILTNPSFKEYVKIGYADNVENRLKQLNNSECIPFAFRVYATYEVEERLTDKKLHSLIDQLNPDLRSIDHVGGKVRVREFYAIRLQSLFIAELLRNIQFYYSANMEILFLTVDIMPIGWYTVLVIFIYENIV